MAGFSSSRDSADGVGFDSSPLRRAARATLLVDRCRMETCCPSISLLNSRWQISFSSCLWAIEQWDLEATDLCAANACRSPPISLAHKAAHRYRPIALAIIGAAALY